MSYEVGSLLCGLVQTSLWVFSCYVFTKDNVVIYKTPSPSLPFPLPTGDERPDGWRCSNRETQTKQIRTPKHEAKNVCHHKWHRVRRTGPWCTQTPSLPWSPVELPKREPRKGPNTDLEPTPPDAPRQSTETEI